MQGLRISILVSFLLFAFLTASGQNPGSDLKKEMMKYQTHKSKEISKYRNLLLNAIEDDSLTVAEWHFDHLLGLLEDETYKTFFPNEKWLLCIWFQRYQVVINEAQNYDRLYTEREEIHIFPQKDLLYFKILEHTQFKFNQIKTEISRTLLKSYEKQFLKLWINSVLPAYDEEESKQEEIAESIEIFEKNYPNNPFSNFISKYVKKEYVQGTRGIGYHLDLGYGWNQDNLKTNFQNPSILEFGVNVNIKSVYLDFFFDYGSSVLKEDITYGDETWLKDESSEMYILGMKTGYMLGYSSGKIIPLIGAGVTQIMPNSYNVNANTKYHDFGTGTGASLIAGLKIQHIIGESEYANFLKQRYQKFNWQLNISTEYHYNYYQDNRFNGGIFMIKIGLGNYFDGSYRNM